MLNKKIISFFLCLSVSVVFFAQNKFDPEWNFGVGFGSTFSNVDFVVKNQRINGSLNSNSIQRFGGGIAARYISEKNIGVICELNFVQYGWNQDFEQFDWIPYFANEPNLSHIHTLNYLELPILTHIYFGNSVRYFVNLGPKFGFLIGEKEELSDDLKSFLGKGGIPYKFVTHQYYRKAERKLDYGLTAGAGVEIRSKIGNFCIEGRYYYGLNDVYNNSKADFFSRSSNQVISAKITYYTKLF